MGIKECTEELIDLKIAQRRLEEPELGQCEEEVSLLYDKIMELLKEEEELRQLFLQYDAARNDEMEKYCKVLYEAGMVELLRVIRV